jgi:hypothetical protein
MGTPSKAKSTKGFKVQRDSDGAGTYVTIGEVTAHTGPSEKSTAIDVTNYDSDGFESIAGLADGGELTFDCNFIGPDVQQQGMRTDMRAGTKRNYKLIFTDHDTTPTTVIFSALVTQAPEPSGSVNNKVGAKATLKVQGIPTWTYAP